MCKFSGFIQFPFIIGIPLILLMGFGPMSPLRAYDVIPVIHGGEISGTIKFKGEPPTNLSFQVMNNPEFCGSTVRGETFIINPENKGIQNVVIRIEDIGRGKKPPSPTLVIENRHCHFIPHVQSGMVGDLYEIKNSDPVLHNTHLHLDESTLMNVAMPPNGKNVKKMVMQKGLINVKCDAHKFMQGWILISDNPYSAVSDQDGKYTISDIPPGKYKITIWHEGIFSQEKEVTISPDKKINLSMDLTLN